MAVTVEKGDLTTNAGMVSSTKEKSRILPVQGISWILESSPHPHTPLPEKVVCKLMWKGQAVSCRIAIGDLPI
jgi:hypothetical protein